MTITLQEARSLSIGEMAALLPKPRVNLARFHMACSHPTANTVSM
jgi:hypothetical protein